MIEVEDLSLLVGRFSLKDISFQVGKGEYFVLLGPTGAGKTLLLETIAGIRSPKTGKIWFDGKEVTESPPAARGVGFVYQDYLLFPHLTVQKNIEFGLRCRGISRREIEEKVSRISDIIGIEEMLSRYPDTLSGGEKQRVALARALAIEPGILLLDEPVSALDPTTQFSILRELKKIHREFKTTTIHITHNFEEAAFLADRIGVVNEGQIVQVGLPEEVFQRPKSEFVANFVGAENLFEGEIALPSSQGQIKNVGADACLPQLRRRQVPVSPNNKVHLTTLETKGVKISVVTDRTGIVRAVLRPEDILVVREPIQSSARNCLRGIITEIESKGVLMKITVDAGVAFRVLLTRDSFEELGLSPGAEVWLSFKATAVHIL